MATIAKLDILIGANTSRMTKGFKRGEKSAESFASRIGKLGGGFGRLGSVIGKIGSSAGSFGPIGLALAGIAASATVATVAIRKTVAEIDDVAKTASKLGDTTEAISSLQLGAELSGVAVNTMNMALQRMTRRMSEAAMGTGEAKAAIKELGLDAQRLSSMTPTNALREIADAMQRVKNPSDKLRLSFKLFDSEGVAVLNTLRGGSAGLDEFREKAERLGVTIDSKGAQSVERASDAFVEFKASLSGVANQLTIALAPALEVGAKLFTDIVVIAVDAAKITRTAFDWLFGVPPAAKEAKRSMEALQAQIANTEAIDKMVSGLQLQIDLFGKSAGAAIEFKAKLKGASDDQIAQIQKLTQEMGRLKIGEAHTKIIDNLREQIAMFGKTAEEAAKLKATLAGADQAQVESIGRLTAKLESLKAAQEQAKDAQTSLQQSMQRGVQIRESLLSPTDRHRNILKDLNALHRVGAIDSNTLSRGIAKSRDELMKFQNQASKSNLSVALKGSREAFEFIAQARIDAEKEKGRVIQAANDAQVAAAGRSRPKPPRDFPSIRRPAIRREDIQADLPGSFIMRPAIEDIDIDLPGSFIIRPANEVKPEARRLFEPIEDIDIDLPGSFIEQPQLKRLDIESIIRNGPNQVQFFEDQIKEFRANNQRVDDQEDGDREDPGGEAFNKALKEAAKDSKDQVNRMDAMIKEGEKTNEILEMIRTLTQQRPKVFKL